MYRAKLFDRPVAKIDKTEAEGYIRLVICEGRVTQPTNDLQYLHKLPCKLFGEEDQDDEDNENEDKRAILAHSASAQSLVWMHDLIGYFLAGRLHPSLYKDSLLTLGNCRCRICYQ